jgi:hypothetical protein
MVDRTIKKGNFPQEEVGISANDGVNNNRTNIDEDHETTGGRSWRISKDLQAFYESHNVTIPEACPPSNPYRFIRLNPRYDLQETLHMLGKELNVDSSKTGVDPSAEKCGTTIDVTNNSPVMKQRQIRPIPVPWLDSMWAFYALPVDYSLASSPCFRSGRIYGMDVSSGAGVAALLTSFHDKESPSDRSVDDTCEETIPPDHARILDLCCCPGLKLLQIADYYSLFMKQPARVVGVDISTARMGKCKAIVQKYLIDRETSGPNMPHPDLLNVQLYRQDGTTFGGWDELSARWSGSSSVTQNLVFDSTVAAEEESTRGSRKRMNKSARQRQTKRLRQLASTEWICSPSSGTDVDVNRNATTLVGDGTRTDCSILLFDRVLVDAECSTDGSFKHIRERIKEGSSRCQHDVLNHEKNSRLMDREKLVDLVALQKRLIASGFRLLKSGGKMVYSTCSLSTDQNEDVVRWLLQKNDDAYLISIHFPSVESTLFVSDGSLAGTVRFAPNLGQECGDGGLFGDGFYLAKIGKR